MKTTPAISWRRHGRITATLLMFGLLPLLGAEPAARSDSPPTWSGHLSYVLGYKRLASEWSPAQDQAGVGLLDVDFKRSDWPVSISAELLMSYIDSRPTLPGFYGNNSGTYEFNLGLRKIFENKSPFHPFLGGGMAVIGGSTSTSFWWDNVLEDIDTSVGYYVEGGGYWHFNEHWHLGIRAEYSSADIKLFGTKLDAGGIHGMLMLGYHW